SPIRFDSGFIPSGSPLMIRAVLSLGAGTSVAFGGDLVASFPPSVELRAFGTPEGGFIEMDFGFEAALQARIDAFGVDETFNITIPYLPGDLRFYQSAHFDPFLLGPSATPIEVSDTIQRFELFNINAVEALIPGASAIGIGGGLRADVTGQLRASYR